MGQPEKFYLEHTLGEQFQTSVQGILFNRIAKNFNRPQKY